MLRMVRAPGYKVTSRGPSVIGGLALLGAAPFAILTAYFYAARAGHFHSQVTDVVALATSILAGLAGLWVLPLRRLVRGVLTLPYVIGLTVLAFFYSLPFVCAYFGDCL